MSKSKFLTYPAVLDWLQWAKFGNDNIPQVTLSLIHEYRDHISELERKLAEKDAVIASLKLTRAILEIPAVHSKTRVIEIMRPVIATARMVNNYKPDVRVTNQLTIMDKALAELEKGDKV